jgi:ribosome-binding protein aMBF1 (putative translation factor)
LGERSKRQVAPAFKFGFAVFMAHAGIHREIVGSNIRTCRANAGMTLEQLAEKAELSWPYLSEVERGRENISLDKLARLAQALDVTLSTLVENA